MKITRNPNANDVGVAKRTYLPFTITASCPKCGTVTHVDLSPGNQGDHYLSYPKVGKPSSLYLSCSNEACGHDWETQVVLNVTLSPVDSSD